MASTSGERRYNLRNIRVVASALLNDDVPEDEYSEEAEEEDETTVDDDVSSEFSGTEEGQEELEEEQQGTHGESGQVRKFSAEEEEGPAEAEMEPANKRQRLLDSTERIRARGRPRRTVIAPSGEKWSEVQPNRAGRCSSVTPNFQASPKLEAWDIRSPFDAFCLLFSADIVDELVIYTNEQVEIELTRLRVNNRVIQHYHAVVDEIEMKAVMGILLHSAVLRQTHLNIKDMWSEQFGCDTYRCVMSEQRFNFLISVLRFDDTTTRAANK